MAKRRDSAYVERRSRDWVKITSSARGRDSEAGRSHAAGALLAFTKAGSSVYAGSVGTGFDARKLAVIAAEASGRSNGRHHRSRMRSRPTRGAFRAAGTRRRDHAHGVDARRMPGIPCSLHRAMIRDRADCKRENAQGCGPCRPSRTSGAMSQRSPGAPSRSPTRTRSCGWVSLPTKGDSGALLPVGLSCRIFVPHLHGRPLTLERVLTASTIRRFSRRVFARHLLGTIGVMLPRDSARDPQIHYIVCDDEATPGLRRKSGRHRPPRVDVARAGPAAGTSTRLNAIARLGRVAEACLPRRARARSPSRW